MDITPGEFESFRSHSSKSRRSDTRSSMKSETTGSLEVLPPEENDDTLFMNEELSDEDDSSIEQKNGDSVDLRNIFPPHTSSTSTTGTSSSPLFDIFEKDPELERLIKKMKKYDRMLQLSTKKEKEVKLQRLLFQKRMMDELNGCDGQNEDKVANNENKFLALMPPPDRLQGMMLELQKDEQPIPIFQTEMSSEESTVPIVCSGPQHNNKPEIPSSEDSPNDKSDPIKAGLKKKIDFIKRNIELAKDAGNHISMTDDEKTRLNELLSDLDEIADSELPDVREAFGQLSLVGQGYTPNEEDGKRLAEIDEKIQSLVPEEEFYMICGTPHLSARAMDMNFNIPQQTPNFNSPKSHPNVKIEEVQKRLEDLDDEWRKTFEGTTPRLTDEQLQRLLDECTLSRSSVNSSLSLRTLTESQASDRDYQHSSTSESYSHTDTPCNESYSGSESNWGELNLSIATKLPSETLHQLLSEARSSLGLPPDSTVTQNEQDTNCCQTPIFQRVEKTGATDVKSPISEQLNVEDV